MHKWGGFANKLLHHLSGWLVSEHLAGDEAGCAGPPGLAWSAVVRPVRWTAKFPEIGDWRLIFKSRATTLVAIPTANCTVRSLKACSSIALCYVLKLHTLEGPFIVTSPGHTCVIITLFNEHCDRPHLSGGWVILAKEQCSLLVLLKSAVMTWWSESD